MAENVFKDINIIYPNGKAHPIRVQYIQVTKDGRYILNYLDYSSGNYVPSFTEILKVNDMWYKNPFHYNYDEYEFEDFDSELSDKIVKELPKNIKLKVRMNDDRKENVPLVIEEQKQEEVNNFGAMEIFDKDNIEAYYVLYANNGDDMIENKSSYPLDFPFPAFSIETNDKMDNHLEIEFSRCGLDNNTRKEIFNKLSNESNDIVISSLDSIETETSNERYRINFVSCPDFNIFNDIYKAKTINVECELEEMIRIEDILKKALSCEIPMTYETELGTVKDNGVSKVGMIK